MTFTSRSYEERLLVAVDRMPRRLRQRANRDVRALAARAPSLRDVRELAANRSADPEVRAWAIWALGTLSERRSKPLLLSILADDSMDDIVLWETGKALVQVGVTGAAVPLLIRMLRKGTLEQRKMAAWALGMGNRSAAARRALEIVVAKKKEHPDVRSHAAEGLGTLARKASVEVLLKGLSDTEPTVRFWVAYALGEIGDRRALPGLRQVVTDGNKVKGFRSVGAEARSAIERIMKKQSSQRRRRPSSENASKI